jgi:hypothetical protein
MAKVQAPPPPPAKSTAKKIVKPAPEPEPVEVVDSSEVETPEINYVTSTQLAAQIGIKSTTLRRWLRTLPQYQDGNYTRYKWEPEDPFLIDAQKHYEEFAEAEEEKKVKRLAGLQAKADKKAAKASAQPEEKPDEEEDEEELESEEEEEEELE